MKCNYCGKCKPVCPIYRVERSEVYSPRGFMTLLNNHVEFVNNCMLCGECEKACPFNTFIPKEIINNLLNINEKKYDNILINKSNKKIFFSFERNLDIEIDTFVEDDEIVYLDSFTEAFYKKDRNKLQKILDTIFQYKDCKIYFINQTEYNFFSVYFKNLDIHLLYNEIKEFFYENSSYFIIEENNINLPDNIFGNKFPNIFDKLIYSQYKYIQSIIDDNKIIISLKNNIDILKNKGIDAKFYLTEYNKKYASTISI